MLLGHNQVVQKHYMKKTLNGRRPQNCFWIGIFQQPLVRSFSNLKLVILGQNQIVQKHAMTYNRPQIKDNIKTKSKICDLRVRRGK
jgi:sRNA-binding regulator protein Hfq